MAPPPHPQILAHWWIWRQKVRKCNLRQSLRQCQDLESAYYWKSSLEGPECCHELCVLISMSLGISEVWQKADDEGADGGSDDIQW